MLLNKIKIHKKFDTVVLVSIGIHIVLQSNVSLMLINFSPAF